MCSRYAALLERLRQEEEARRRAEAEAQAWRQRLLGEAPRGGAAPGPRRAPRGPEAAEPAEPAEPAACRARAEGPRSAAAGCQGSELRRRRAEMRQALRAAALARKREAAAVQRWRRGVHELRSREELLAAARLEGQRHLRRAESIQRELEAGDRGGAADLAARRASGGGGGSQLEEPARAAAAACAATPPAACAPGLPAAATARLEEELARAQALLDELTPGRLGPARAAASASPRAPAPLRLRSAQAAPPRGAPPPPPPHAGLAGGAGGVRAIREFVEQEEGRLARAGPSPEERHAEARAWPTHEAAGPHALDSLEASLAELLAARPRKLRVPLV